MWRREGCPLKGVGASGHTAGPSPCSPSLLCSKHLGFLSPVRAFALAASSSRKVTAPVCLPLVTSQVSSPIPSPWRASTPTPTALTCSYYHHRANAVHLFTCLSRSPQSAVSKTELSTSRYSVSICGMQEKRTHTGLHQSWAGRMGQLAWKEVRRTLSLRNCPFHLRADPKSEGSSQC